MVNKDLEKTEVIEAEVLDESGRPINTGGGNRRASGQQYAGGGANAFATAIKAIAILTGTFLFALMMMLLFVLLFLPILALRALGLFKGDFKVYKWPGK